MQELPELAVARQQQAGNSTSLPAAWQAVASRQLQQQEGLLQAWQARQQEAASQLQEGNKPAYLNLAEWQEHKHNLKLAATQYLYTVTDGYAVVQVMATTASAALSKADFSYDSDVAEYTDQYTAAGKHAAADFYQDYNTGKEFIVQASLAWPA